MFGSEIGEFHPQIYRRGVKLRYWTERYRDCIQDVPFRVRSSKITDDMRGTDVADRTVRPGETEVQDISSGQRRSRYMSIFEPPQAEKPKTPTSAARGALGLALASFLFAFLFGYLGASNPVFLPIAVSCDWLTLAFLVAAGILYVLRK